MRDLLNAFKESVLQSELMLELTPEYILICMSISLLCAAIAYAVYRIFYRGVCYSENFNVLIVMTAMITTFCVMTISANLVLSLGMVGALSIVRFRSAVKDPLDVGFLFWAVAIGITSGAGLFQYALICTLFIAIIFILLSVVRIGGKTYLLVVKYDDDAKDTVEAELKKLHGRLKNKTKSKTLTEQTIQVKFITKERKAVYEKVSSINGVSNIMLVEFTGDM